MNHFGLIRTLLAPDSGASAELRDLVTARAFEDPDEADSFVENLIDSDSIDVHSRWGELKHHPSLDVRFAAWAKKFETATVEDWELAIATTRRKSPLWTLITAHVPLAELSNDALCAFYGVKATGKLTQPEARAVIEPGFKPGLEALWVRALAAMNPAAASNDVLGKAIAPLTDGFIRSVPATLHPFYRFTVACCAFSTPGTLAALYEQDPTLGTTFPPNVMGHVTAYGDWVRANITGRAGDLEAYHQVRVNVGNQPPRTELDILLKVIASGDVAEQLRVSEQFYAPKTFSVWQSFWDHLPEELRTDQVCAYLLNERDAPLELHREVVTYLGERAIEVCEKHGLLAPAGTGRFGAAPAWLADVDPLAWVVWVRESLTGYAGVVESLEDVHPGAIHSAAADLLADPFAWDASFGPGAAVADAAGFGPDEWAQLSISQVLTIANRNAEAKQWITSVFNENTDTTTPLLWEALRTSFEADLRITELLAAVRAITV